MSRQKVVIVGRVCDMLGRSFVGYDFNDNFYGVINKLKTLFF